MNFILLQKLTVVPIAFFSIRLKLRKQFYMKTLRLSLQNTKVFFCIKSNLLLNPFQ